MLKTQFLKSIEGKQFLLPNTYHFRMLMSVSRVSSRSWGFVCFLTAEVLIGWAKGIFWSPVQALSFVSCSAVGLLFFRNPACS